MAKPAGPCRKLALTIWNRRRAFYSDTNPELCHFQRQGVCLRQDVWPSCANVDPARRNGM